MRFFISLKRLVVVLTLVFALLVTFRDVPGNAPEEHLAGVQRVLVVPGRQLTAPGERGLVHSWRGEEEDILMRK